MDRVLRGVANADPGHPRYKRGRVGIGRFGKTMRALTLTLAPVRKNGFGRTKCTFDFIR